LKTLTSKQQEAIYYLNQPDITELIYGGAAGGGKSALGCLRLIEQCQKYEGSRWLMGRSKLKTLKETTLNTFFEIATIFKLSSQYTYNQQSGTIRFKNGSEIILKDLYRYPSDPEFDSLGSLEITGGFVDEVSQISYKAWQITKSRIRYKLNEFNLTPKLLGSCNPSKGWTYKEFYKPKKEGTLKKDRAFIQALPTDNPHLHPSYLESLLTLDEISKQRLYYGNWEYDDDPSSLMDYDSIVDLFTNSFVKSGERYISADIARFGEDMTVIMVWEGLRMIYMESMPKSKTTEVCDKIRALQNRYSVSNSNTIADEDGVGGGVVDSLGCKGFVNASRPIEQSGELKNYANLRSQGYFTLANAVNDKLIYLNISAGEIRDTIAEELEQIKQKDIDKDGKLAIIPKDDIKSNIGRSPDYADCIMMRMWFELAPKRVMW
jgi:phage terminase large subunit